jgi:hypothetical protein
VIAGATMIWLTAGSCGTARGTSAVTCNEIALRAADYSINLVSMLI